MSYFSLLSPALGLMIGYVSLRYVSKFRSQINTLALAMLSCYFGLMAYTQPFNVAGQYIIVLGAIYGLTAVWDSKKRKGIMAVIATLLLIVIGVATAVLAGGLTSRLIQQAIKNVMEYIGGVF